MKRLWISMVVAGLGLGAALAQAPREGAATAAKPDNLTATLKSDLQKALYSTEGFDALKVKVQKTAVGLWVLNVAPAGVGWNSGTTDGYQHSEATILAGWFDSENKLLGNLAQEEVFKRVIPHGDAVYSIRAQTPQGAVRVRFVVRDALNGNLGTVDLTSF